MYHGASTKVTACFLSIGLVSLRTLLHGPNKQAAFYTTDLLIYVISSHRRKPQANVQAVEWVQTVVYRDIIVMYNMT